MDEIRRGISQIPILKGLPAKEQELLAGICKLEKASRGKFLAHAGGVTKDILFLIDGAVKLSQSTPEGKEMIIALLGPGEHVGMVSLLTGVQRPNDVIVTCRSNFLRINAVDFKKILHSLPALSYELLLSLAKRLEQTSRHLAEISLYNLDLRLALRLLELAVIVDIEDRECLLVRQRPSHQDLADLLGVSREAITRSLKKLETDGHIEIADDQIRILSTPK